jgi:ABC-type transport system substrate-binding protein
MSSWNGRPTTYGGLYAYFYSKGSYNTAKYSNALLDACLDEAVGEINPVKATKRYSAAQALISEDGGVIVPYLKDLLFAYRNNIQNLALYPTRLLSFVGVWKA